jgi:hypothetical protein
VHKRKYISILISSLFLIAIYYSVTLYFYYDDLSKIDLLDNEIALIKGSRLIGELWQKGDADNWWENDKANCSSFLGKFSVRKKRRTRCNPAFLKCYLKNINFTVNYNNKKYIIKTDSFSIVAKSLTNNSEIPNFGVKLSLYSNQMPTYIMPIILEDNCNDIYIPKNVYGINQYTGVKNSKNWQWDNLNQNIFLDKFLVTFYDIFIWAKLTKNKTILEKVKGRTKSWLPATNLTKNEMKQYCAFRGKQILTAKLFDAATFLPLLNKSTSKIIFRSPYPFHHHKIENLFSNKIAVTKKSCKIAYTKECISRFSPTELPLVSYSWSGLFEIFGGPLKYQKNRVYEKENLFISSKYLNKGSKWHQLGKRSYWNKIYLKKILNKDTFEIAFRCIEYGYEYEYN